MDVDAEDYVPRWLSFRPYNPNVTQNLMVLSIFIIACDRAIFFKVIKGT